MQRARLAFLPRLAGRLEISNGTQTLTVAGTTRLFTEEPHEPIHHHLASPRGAKIRPSIVGLTSERGSIMDESHMMELLSEKSALDHTMQVRLTADQLNELDEFIASVNDTTEARLTRSKVTRVALAAFLEGLREGV